jgi:hypothetical protein
VALQAIGSEVAALTNSSEVTKAPARLTASWRLSRNEKVIFDTPFCEPLIGLTTFIAGSVPVEKYRYFSVMRLSRQRISPVIGAKHWEIFPTSR